MIRGLTCLKMKRSCGIAVTASFCAILILRYWAIDSAWTEILFFPNASDRRYFKSETAEIPETPVNVSVIWTPEVLSSLFKKQDFSDEETRSLLTWNQFRHSMQHVRGLPNAAKAVHEAIFVWKNLAGQFWNRKKHEEKQDQVRRNQCPYSIRTLEADSSKLKIPCGMIQGSSVTVIGTPTGILGEFKIELIGETLPGDLWQPVVLNVHVRPMGDKQTDDPVIVQNAWTLVQELESDERCPSPLPDDLRVDGLEKCSGVVGPKNFSSMREAFFPFRVGHRAIITLRIGAKGIQMSVDGMHITSFAYRQGLEPWLVSQVQISGEFKPISLLAGGLPTSEDSEQAPDLQTLTAAPLAIGQPLTMFVGVVSTANNFKRRMAVRRTWMQYDAVKYGRVAVRFFVGLHKNQMVNEELWNEAQSYGDVQLLPFVDYYSLLSWKSIAICIFGTDVVSAEYVMKTDDDSFVRVDEVLRTLAVVNVSRGMLYGLLRDDDGPHRDSDSKWYISPEEWPEEKYPPWAHGPGYVVSRDVAKFVRDSHRSGRLKMFKLEDVAMGIWVAEMKRSGAEVRYVNETRIYVTECREGYVVAHYQVPRDMLCLWQSLKNTSNVTCCSNR